MREPEKLRAWLCGIARNRINNFLRSEGREPSHRAESLEEISESHSSEPLPAEQTISNEEQAILWRSLEKIPEIYREPLVLFYREHQSIEAVAQSLDLSEDAVKQRLSRGRKLLQEQVLAFVEGALEQTIPGKAFTLGVLASLPVMATSAKAAVVGATAATANPAATGANQTLNATDFLSLLTTQLANQDPLNPVDDIRALRESVAYAPVSGRQKIYILDEAHMLSTAAWNASSFFGSGVPVLYRSTSSWS